MLPINFPEQNIIYAENQTQYLPLPAYKADDENGVVTSCWKLSFLEKIKVLFRGRVYISQMTFNKKLQPIMAATNFNDHKIYCNCAGDV